MLWNLLFYYFARLLPHPVGIRHGPGTLPGAEVLSEHPGRVDGNEQTAASRQDLSLVVQDLGDVHVLASADRAFPPFYYQTLAQGHELQIFDVHGLGDRDDGAQLVHLAHCLVEDGGDDAAVSVSGRSLKP